MWSWTRVHVDLPDRPAPYVLAYVDLDDGPRIVLHVGPDTTIAVDDRVRLETRSDSGDLVGSVVPAPDNAERGRPNHG